MPTDAADYGIHGLVWVGVAAFLITFTLAKIGVVTKKNSATASTWASGITAALVVLNMDVNIILGAIIFGGLWFVLALVLSVAVAAAVEKGSKH